MDAISADIDWCFYIQGDEVVHEQFLPTVKSAMEKYVKNLSVEGLLFKYEHFFGSYEYVGDSPDWYRREIRIVRKDSQIRSYKDAQGFRTIDNKKLNLVRLLPPCISFTEFNLDVKLKEYGAKCKDI